MTSAFKPALSGFALIAVLCCTFNHAPAAELKLQKDDHICLVGNALGERMQVHNQWETLLHARFPDHHLVVRNLCFPAD